LETLQNRDLKLAEVKELNGLLEKTELSEDQYNSLTFSEAHRNFKKSHNDVLVSLTRYCSNARRSPESVNVFYLDGPDAGTTSALIRAGIDATRCFVANRHLSSCISLRRTGLPSENVEHLSASDSLQGGGAIGRTMFSVFFFDGCGGYTTPILKMISAAFSEYKVFIPPVAVGFSILGGNRDVIDKEQAVMRELASIATRRGLRIEHVFDEPLKYGVDIGTRKVEGAVFTTWCVFDV